MFGAYVAIPRSLLCRFWGYVAMALRLANNAAAYLMYYVAVSYAAKSLGCLMSLLFVIPLMCVSR